MAIGSDVNVGGANALNNLLGADEAVVEDHLRFHPDVLRQRLQTGSILIPLATKDVGMSRACDDVHNVLVFGQNLRQRLNHVFDPFIRREQAEREKYSLAFDPKSVLIEVRIEEGQVRNSVGNHVNFATGHFEDFLQELG